VNSLGLIHGRAQSGGDTRGYGADDVPVNKQSSILEIALEMGLDLVGFTPLEPPGDAAHFEAWLDRGFGADMDWLHRNRDRISDPRGLASGPAVLLVAGLGHARSPVELPGGGRVARYAAGRDYHNRLGKLLIRLGKRLEREGLLVGGRAGRAMTDAAPILERSHAAQAGLGFASKAANLLNVAHGPWFFIGELVLEMDPATTEGPTLAPAGSCGTCTACLDECPTKAIVAPGQVDARLCISYQTIENRGPVPHELRAKLSGFVFGCDICSEVCPWGKKAESRSDRSEGWGLHPAVEQHSLLDLLEQPAASFKEEFRGSPLQRPRREGLARNAALVLGMAPREGSREALAQALKIHDSPMVREAAAWALAVGHSEDEGVRDDLENAARNEPVPEWKALLERDRSLAE
jgi:epoxyqueuosine reductase